MYNDYLLLEDTRDLTLRLILSLRTRDGSQHRIGTTDEDLGILILGSRQVLLDGISSDEALESLPVLGRAIEGVDNLEAIGMFLSVGIKLLLEQDVFLGLVGEDKSNLGSLIRGVLIKDLADDLELRKENRYIHEHVIHA